MSAEAFVGIPLVKCVIRVCSKNLYDTTVIRVDSDNVAMFQVNVDAVWSHLEQEGTPPALVSLCQQVYHTIEGEGELGIRHTHLLVGHMSRLEQASATLGGGKSISNVSTI